MNPRTIKPADVENDVRHGEDVDYIEYGIQLPNGRIWWADGMGFPMLLGVEMKRLNLEINQEKAKEAYREHLDRQGVTYDERYHELRFVQRLHQIRFTAPEPLPGEGLKEFGEES